MRKNERTKKYRCKCCHPLWGSKLPQRVLDGCLLSKLVCPFNGKAIDKELEMKRGMLTLINDGEKVEFT